MIHNKRQEISNSNLRLCTFVILLFEGNTMASNSSVIDCDNTSSLHQAMVDPDHLCGPQVIQAMMKTPGKYQLNL